VPSNSSASSHSFPNPTIEFSVSGLSSLSCFGVHVPPAGPTIGQVSPIQIETFEAPSIRLSSAHVRAKDLPAAGSTTMPSSRSCVPPVRRSIRAVPGFSIHHAVPHWHIEEGIALPVGRGSSGDTTAHRATHKWNVFPIRVSSLHSLLSNPFEVPWRTTRCRAASRLVSYACCEL